MPTDPHTSKQAADAQPRSSPATADAPGNAPSKAQRWLARSADGVQASSAVLLVRQGEKVSAAARYPMDAGNDRGLISLAHRAFEESFCTLRSPAKEGRQEVCAAFAIRLAGRPAVIAFRLRIPEHWDDGQLRKQLAARVLRREDDAQPAAGSVNPQTSISPLLEHSARRAERQAQAAVTPDSAAAQSAQPAAEDATMGELLAEQGAVLDVLASTLDQDQLRQALHALVNAIARHTRSQRVTLGLTRGRHVRLYAVSGMADFDPRSALMVDIAQAMQETRSAAAAIRLPQDVSGQVLPQNHVALAEQLRHPALLSLPLVDHKRVTGVLLLERDTPFTAAQEQQLTRLCLLLGPVVSLKQTQAMGPGQWIRRYSRRFLRALLGNRYLGLKIGAVLSTLLVAWSLLYTSTFRIDAEASIEATVQRAVVAAFPSFISQVERRAGDIVQQGDVLARLDVEDLALDKIKWEGEREKLRKEYRANLVRRDRSKVRVLEAQQAQAQTQIDLLDAQLARAVLRAPIDGVVISGDLSQSLGSPVERGELLFEVASLDDYRLVLLVDEQDIGWIEQGQQGSLRLRSLPEQNFPFQVTAITPVSEPGNGANSFRVEASLDGLPEDLRPGMGGYAKIDVESQPIGWIWTRRFVDWVRVQLWKYGGV